MARAADCTTVELPTALRDRLASHRLHSRQALHQVIAEALASWEARGAWTGTSGPWHHLGLPHPL